MTNIIPFPKIFGASDRGERVQLSRFARTAADGRTSVAFVVCSVDARGRPEVPVWEGPLYRDAIEAAEKASADWRIPIEIDIRRVRQ
jgi:hypothetical protein